MWAALALKCQDCRPAVGATFSFSGRHPPCRWAYRPRRRCPAIVALHNFPPEPAMAVEVREVESNRVIAGGVTAANIPQLFKNSRRSSLSVSRGHRCRPSIIKQ